MEPVKLPAGYLLPDGATMADVQRLELELLASEGLKIEDLQALSSRNSLASVLS